MDKNVKSIQKKINKTKSQKVDLYTSYKKKDEKLDNIIKKQEEKIHPFLVRKYNDSELRKDILNEARENCYPEELLQDLKLYTEENTKWDLNISDDVLEQFEKLQLYNADAKKQRGLWRRFVDKLQYVFQQGGDGK